VTRLAVGVKAPKTTHEVSLRQLERWVAATPKSPKRNDFQIASASTAGQEAVV
jgi:hypothetical protein